MFEDPSPSDKAHMDLLAALEKLDEKAVREICLANPGVEQPRAGWNGSPMQRLLTRNSFIKPPQAIWACLDALIEAGAKLQQPHSYSHSPLQTLLDHGNVATLQHLLEKGTLQEAIKDGVNADRCLHHICTSTRWKEQGNNYPLAELTRILIEAGEEIHSNRFEDASALHRLLYSAVPSYGFPRPNNIEQAVLMLIEHDEHTVIKPGHLKQAFNANMPTAFNLLAKRYLSVLEADELSSGVDEGVRVVLDKMKPEEKATFEAWWIKAQTAAPSTPAVDARRMRI